MPVLLPEYEGNQSESRIVWCKLRSKIAVEIRSGRKMWANIGRLWATRSKLHSSDFLKSILGSVLARSVGALIPIFVGWWFGLNGDTDLFFMAFSIIMFVTVIFSSTMETVSVPFFADFRYRKEDIGAFVGSVLLLTVAATIAIVVIVLFTLRPILSAITSLGPERVKELVNISLLLVPVFGFVIMSSLLVGAQNASESYLEPSFAAALRSVIVVIVMFATRSHFGIYSIPFGYLIGEGAKVGFLLRSCERRSLFRIKFLAWPSHLLSEFFSKGSFHMISALLGGLNPIVDRYMALWLGVGSISVIEYADRLNSLPVTIYGSVLLVYFSRWTNQYYGGSVQRIHPGKLVKRVILLTLTLTIVGLFFSRQIVTFTFFHGKFPEEMLGIVGNVFSIYLAGFMPYAIIQIYVRIFLVGKETRALMVFSSVRLIFNVVTDYVFMQIWGVAGIALSTTVCSVIIAGIMALYHSRGALEKTVVQPVSAK